MATTPKGLSLPNEDKALLAGTAIALGGLFAPGLDLSTRLDVLGLGVAIAGFGKALGSMTTSA